MENIELITLNKLLGDVTSLDGFVGHSVFQIDGDEHSHELVFHLTETNRVRFYHEQDCCESVWIEDICGNLNDLIDAPILSFEEVIEYPDSSELGGDESETWTFYKIQSSKGHVTIRWCGSSNGYYSESVDCEFIT